MYADLQSALLRSCNPARDTAGVASRARDHCRYRLDDLDAIADAVTRGMGLSWLPYWLVRKRIEAGTLVRIMPDQKPFLYDSSKSIPKRQVRRPMRAQQ